MKKNIKNVLKSFVNQRIIHTFARFLWSYADKNTVIYKDNRINMKHLLRFLTALIAIIFSTSGFSQTALYPPSQVPEQQAIDRCDIIQKTFNYPYYYCDCHENNTVDFYFGLDTIITDTLWFSASIAELKYGMSAYWFSDKPIRLELYALCSSTDPTFTMTVGGNTMRDIDVDFINKKLSEMGDLAEMAETIVKPHLRVYPLKGGEGRVLAFAYDEGPVSSCEDLFPVKHGMTYITNHDNDIYAWCPADMRKDQQMFVQWYQKDNLPCEMEFLRGTCSNPELICARTLKDSTKLFFPDINLVNEAKAAGDTLFFRFKHKPEEVGRVRFYYNIKWREMEMDTTFCEGLSFQLPDTILTQSTDYTNDTVWYNLDTVDIYTRHIHVTPAKEKRDTLRVFKSDLPMYYRTTYYIDRFGEHNVVIKRKNTCLERIRLQVIDREGDALDETTTDRRPRKALHNGTLYIIYDNRRYSVLGTEQKQQE